MRDRPTTGDLYFFLKNWCSRAIFIVLEKRIWMPRAKVIVCLSQNSENFPAQQTVFFGADTCQRQKMEEYFWDCVVFPQLKGSLCEVCFG